MPKLLLIDDSEFIREYLEEFFEYHEFEITGSAGTVDDGVKLYKETASKPDLVIMDMILPGKDGIEGIKEILNIDKTAKILICSALGQEMLIFKAFEAGAKGYIVKPFKEEKILEKVRKILTESDSESEIRIQKIILS